MKKFNLTIIAAIVATLVLSMFAFETVTTKASSDASPSATPRKRKTSMQTNANVKVKKPIVRGAINGDDDWVRKPRQSRRKRGIPAPTPSPVTKQIGVPAPTPSPEN
jgi:hypothetical protein